MNVFAAIYGRRAIRDFEGRTPGRGLLTDVVTDAVQAPSSVNRQAWAFTILTDRARLEEAAREAKAHALANMPAQTPDELRRFLADPDFHIFYNAPALIVISATLPDPMVAEDCCLAAQTLMLSAYARGLGTCWIGFAEGWIRSEEGKRRLGIPAGHIPVAPLIVGHPRERPAPTGRKAPVIDWIGIAPT